ncbi:MAG: chemotaxis-specific protein-glutamate methyltransferase CheB [Lachnospiraceae bacterium]|nr:chemotaxis-specific protein-glutamate methyltransferase CheB [Lachnospiraceae bacterium]
MNLNSQKRILVVDDSALMRRVLCDIINADGRFVVEDTAMNGQIALDYVTKKKYDAIVLDVNMPVMNGIEFLKELQKRRIPAKVIMASTDTTEGAKVTMDCLDLGALDFVHKPNQAMDCRNAGFVKALTDILAVAANGKEPKFEKPFDLNSVKRDKKLAEIVSRSVTNVSGKKIVAIASSTGGPKALQSVIPRLPKNLNAPVVLVQHMPVGFTKSLADRLDSLSDVAVSEAAEGDELVKGHVYIAKGGAHMNIVSKAGKSVIHFSDEPTREGVKPCANYMYESLANSPYDQVVCVVMTGMGQDGTEGVTNLKKNKKVHVIAQQEASCAVYGMPRAVVNAGLADQVVDLNTIAQEIIMNVGTN